MHCVSCALTIDGDLEDAEGVKEASTNYAKGETKVKFDSDKLTAEDILKIVKQTGYDAVLVNK